MRNLIGLFVFSLFVVCCFSVRAAERPNVLLILADDVGRELLGCYGGESYATPNLDALANRGMRFETCYATPLCVPSRVELLTGCYSFRNYTRWGQMDEGLTTVAQLMRQAGYATGFAGKWHLGGWVDGEEPLVVRAGFQEYCSYDAAQVLEDSKSGNGNRYWGGRIIEDGKSSQLQGYGPDQFSDYLVKFMRRHREEPFFAYYAMTLMHRPFHPTADHPQSSAPPAEWLGPRGKAENFEPMLTYTDRMVGKLLTELEALGIDDRTLVIFTSDNGTDNKQEARGIRSQYRNRSVRGGKYFPTELGASVPLIVRWPGRVQANKVSRALVDFTDLLPTICDVAGADLPNEGGFDGQSLLPVLTDKREHHKPFVYTWGNFDQSSRKYKEPAKYREELLDVVRGERWKLYSDGRMFDLQSDYFEEQKVEDLDAKRRLGSSRDELRNSGKRAW